MAKELSTIAKVRISDCDPIGHLNNIQYLKYMQDAREDHIEELLGYTFEDYMKKTGCTWVTIKNEIAYLKEVRTNTKVKISSKSIVITDKIDTIEMLMTSEDGSDINAVLWVSVIYFNMKTRRGETQPQDLKEIFFTNFEALEQKTFNERVDYLRSLNKK